MATKRVSRRGLRAWEKVADRFDTDEWQRKDFYLDGLSDAPSVSLRVKKDANYPDGAVKYVVEAHDGNESVGEVDAYYFPNESEWVSVSTAFIGRRFRGQGLYPEMLKKLRDFVQEDGRRGVVSRGEGRVGHKSTASWDKFASREPRVMRNANDYYLSALPKTGRISLATAKRALKLLPPGRQACKITAANLRDGLEVEREHRDVTRLGLKKTALIAASHLCESPRYYTELKKLERRLKRSKK